MENWFHILSWQFMRFGAPEMGDTRYNVRILEGPLFCPKLNLTFNFTCNFITQRRRLPQDSQDVIEMGTQPNIEASANITIEQHMDRLEAVKTLQNQINHWPLAEHMRKQVLQFALKKSYKAIQEMPRHCDAIQIHYPVTVVHQHSYVEQSEIELVMERSMEEGQAHMVPALESSIESLKSVVMLVDSDETCTVCLELRDDRRMQSHCNALLPCVSQRLHQEVAEDEPYVPSLSFRNA